MKFKKNIDILSICANMLFLIVIVLPVILSVSSVMYNVNISDILIFRISGIFCSSVIIGFMIATSTSMNNIELLFCSFIIYLLFFLLFLYLMDHGKSYHYVDYMASIYQWLQFFLIGKYIKFKNFYFWESITFICSFALVYYTFSPFTGFVVFEEGQLPHKFFGTYQLFGSVISYLFLLSLLFSNTQHVFIRGLFYLVLLLLIGSRTDFIGLLLVLLILAIIRRRYLVLLLTSVIILSILGPFMNLLGENLRILHYVSDFDTSSIFADDLRVDINAETIHVIMENPLWGNFGYSLPGMHAHNFLGVYADFGLLMFVLFLCLQFSLVIGVVKLGGAKQHGKDVLLAFVFLNLFTLATSKNHMHFLTPALLGLILNERLYCKKPDNLNQT